MIVVYPVVINHLWTFLHGMKSSSIGLFIYCLRENGQSCTKCDECFVDHVMWSRHILLNMQEIESIFV